MQLKATQLTSLLGAIMLSSGLASSVALADESKQSDDATTPVVQIEESHGLQAKETPNAMIKVRISMPDGRTIIRYEPARKSSARRSFPSSSPAGSRSFAGGSTVRSGHSSVNGGSRSSSAGSGGSRSGGSGSGLAGGGASSSSSSGGGSAKVPTHSRASGGLGSSGSANAPGSSSSSGSSSSKVGAHRTIHTVGGARYNEEGAVGGQRVEFHDGDMGAAVIGNTVYFNNVQFVQANQNFEIVTGTRVGADSAIMKEGRLSPSGSGPLSSWNTGSSAIKLDFDSDTVIELVMFSEPENSITPDRIQRTWTVRIR